MLDLDMDNVDITRPRQRTTLIALELERYGIDIAALSERQARQHGVGLAIWNEPVDKNVEAPTFVNERLPTLRIPLVKEEYAAVLSCYAPTVTSKEILKDAFYELLYQALSSIHKDDKIILFGASVWDGVIGRNGVRRMNSSG